MAPDLIKPNDILYYMGYNGEWNAIGGVIHLDLKNSDSESTYCDIGSSLLETTSSVTFDMKTNKKQWYKIQKELGLIKPIYKKIRKGKRYVWYEKSYD